MQSMIKRLFILLITFMLVKILQEKINLQIKVAPSSCASSFECRELIIDESGVSVSVDFVFKNNNQPKFLINNEMENTEAQKMLINLYTSITMLVLSCQSFSSYDCQRYSCQEYPNNTRTSLHPYFIAKGYDVEANMSLAKWSLNRDAMTILSTSCFAGVLDNYGAGTYGALGLGVSGAAWKNFMCLDPIFSIYLYQDNSGGEMWFSRNLNKTISNTPSTVLIANNSWHVENIQGIGVGNKTIQLNDTKLIFDTNVEEIGLRLKVYKTVMQALTQGDVPIRCDDYTKIFYRPNCNYHGELKDLPNITVYVGDQNVIIPPWVYVLSPETFDNVKGNLTLNLKGNYDVTHLPEIHVITQYKNHIILGRGFMKYYYTVFNGADHMQNKTQIELYAAVPSPFNANSDGIKIWVIILFAIALFFIAIILAGCKYVRWRKNRGDASASVNHSRHSEGAQHQEPPAENLHEDAEPIVSAHHIRANIDQSQGAFNVNSFQNNDGEGPDNLRQAFLLE